MISDLGRELYRPSGDNQFMWLSPALAFCCLVFRQDPVTLDSLEAELKAFTPDRGFFADVAPIRKINDGVLKLVSEDRLKVAGDFRRASKLFTVLNWDFEDAREKYELTLTGFALGDKDAERSIPMDWDTLQISSGRRQRMGSMSLLKGFDGDRFALDNLPKSIVDTVTDPDKARSLAKDVANNAILQTTVDADQKDRSGDFTKMKNEDLLATMKHDRERLALTKSMIVKSKARTAQDFFNAALVLQHGEIASDFALSHELCLCSILLGDQKEARWLAAASYDRMLRHAGQRQRFATQYDSEGLQRLDSEGINDTMRQALHCPSLTEAKKRVFKAE